MYTGQVVTITVVFFHASALSTHILLNIVCARVFVS